MLHMSGRYKVAIPIFLQYDPPRGENPHHRKLMEFTFAIRQVICSWSFDPDPPSFTCLAIQWNWSQKTLYRSGNRLQVFSSLQLQDLFLALGTLVGCAWFFALFNRLCLVIALSNLHLGAPVSENLFPQDGAQLVPLQLNQIQNEIAFCIINCRQFENEKFHLLFWWLEVGSKANK